MITPRMTRIFGLLLATIAVLSFATGAFAITKDELKERFKARAPAIRAAKDAEKIGEVWNGRVEETQPDKTKDDKELQDLIRAENGDRAQLYQIIAEEEGTTAEHVAERAGKRNCQRAQTGDWLKYRDGVWRKKE